MTTNQSMKIKSWVFSNAAFATSVCFCFVAHTMSVSNTLLQSGAKRATSLDINIYRKATTTDNIINFSAKPPDGTKTSRIPPHD
jgi:hypothetical protein